MFHIYVDPLNNNSKAKVETKIIPATPPQSVIRVVVRMSFYNDILQIASEDKDQCGLRLVCELAQRDPRDLAEDEVQILLPFK